MAVTIKRIYDNPTSDDGYRVLVDRLWPRGVSKQKACLDLWLKDVAPSPELRKWFGHDPAKFKEFNERYKNELANNPALEDLKKLYKQHRNLTLLYAAKDQENNEAVVLQKILG